MKHMKLCFKVLARSVMKNSVQNFKVIIASLLGLMACPSQGLFFPESNEPPTNPSSWTSDSLFQLSNQKGVASRMNEPPTNPSSWTSYSLFQLSNQKGVASRIFVGGELTLQHR